MRTTQSSCACAAQGLIDIDKPLAEYGVKPATSDGGSGPQFERGHSWGSFWPNVTVRSLLAQSSGYGVVPPGSSFTYDSQEYIQHLSYALAAVVPGGDVLKWARANYAVPLGFDSFFDYDDVQPDQGGPQQISAGGGQMVTCREMARFGQLIVNRGKWLDKSGQPYQLADPKHIEALTQPACACLLSVPAPPHPLDQYASVPGVRAVMSGCDRHLRSGDGRRLRSAHVAQHRHDLLLLCGRPAFPLLRASLERAHGPQLCGRPSWPDLWLLLPGRAGLQRHRTRPVQPPPPCHPGKRRRQCELPSHPPSVCP